MEKPPVRTTGTRSLVLLLLAGFGTFLLVAWFIRPKPPKESNLVQNFCGHRAAYERLRDMLQADGQIDRLADWGVMTTKGRFCVPPDGDFPAERYREYMSLLKEVGGLEASRSQGQHADPDILVWAWGWPGRTRHIGICWLDQAPTNQIAALDGYRSRRYPERVVAYRHIEGNWYLWTDL